MNFIRFTSTKTPRFLKTLSETSKPPITKPGNITRPFGLPAPILLNPPSATKWSLKNDVFGEDAKEMRQRQLDHDIKHSPFYESKSFTNTNGKIFNAPISYFKLDKALYFPNFIAKSLQGTERQIHDMFKDKVSLVRVFSTVSGEQCTESFLKHDEVDYLKDYEQFISRFPHSQIIDINIPHGWAKSLIVNIVKGSIKRSLPETRRDNYFVVPEKLFSYDIKQELNCDNSCSGYIYLVDQNGKIRWAASGYSDEKEQQLLWKCLNGVSKELQ